MAKEKIEEGIKIEEKIEKKTGIKVGDPQVLRPKELPLVVEPESGKWENDKQAEFAKVVNAYAYKNPEKWQTKKDILIAQLEEIGKNPNAIIKYRGNVGTISYKNKLMEL